MRPVIVLLTENSQIFLIAVFNMAAKRSPWGIWLLFPLYLLPIAMLVRHFQQQGASSPQLT
jgi:hypothetical protein